MNRTKLFNILIFQHYQLPGDNIIAIGNIHNGNAYIDIYKKNSNNKIIKIQTLNIGVFNFPRFKLAIDQTNNTLIYGNPGATVDEKSLAGEILVYNYDSNSDKYYDEPSLTLKKNIWGRVIYLQKKIILEMM